MFAALFLSSMSLPRNLIETDWFRTVATYNPVSYMLEGIRSLVIEGWDGEALALGVACAGGVAADRADAGVARPAHEDGARDEGLSLGRARRSPGAARTTTSRTRRW